jgi:hypothetical protein
MPALAENVLRQNIERSLEVHCRFMKACLPGLTPAADALIATYKVIRHCSLVTGGSAADGQNLAADFSAVI